MISNNSTYKEIATGAIAGFIGQYIGDFIYNIIENEGYSIEIRSNESSYIAGIVSGGAVAIFNNKLSTFQSVVLSVGLFYLVFDSVDQLFGNNGMRNSNFIKEFIIDVVVIYILVLIQNTFFDKFLPNFNQNEEEFSDEVVVTLITGIIINTYYDFKKIINKRKNSLK